MDRKQAQAALREYFDVPASVGNSGKIITDGEVAHFLLSTARDRATFVCPDPHCEVCNTFSAVWWDWMTELPRPVRVRVQSLMRSAGIPFPPGPWEEVPTDAVFTPLN